MSNTCLLGSSWMLRAIISSKFGAPVGLRTQRYLFPKVVPFVFVGSFWIIWIMYFFAINLTGHSNVGCHWLMLRPAPKRIRKRKACSALACKFRTMMLPSFGVQAGLQAVEFRGVQAPRIPHHLETDFGRHSSTSNVDVR